MKTKILLLAGILVVMGLAKSPLTNSELRADDDQNVSGRNQSALAELDRELVAEMAKAAERTYEATDAAYNAGAATSTELYVWSRRWLDGQRALAKTNKQEMAALRVHRERMKRLFLKINALYIEGVKGGEAERFHAAQYYLTEATALVEQATAPEKRGPAKVEVAFHGPEGMLVQWDKSGDGAFDSEVLTCPANQNFRRGRIYRMRFARLPGFKGLNANATLELTAPFAGPVPIGLATSDAEAVLRNGGAYRVFYTDDSEVRSIGSDWNTSVDELVSEAEDEGTVLAILRLWRAP